MPIKDDDMSGFFIDPKVVNDFLDKPYNLKEVWNRVSGSNPDSTASYHGDTYYNEAERRLCAVEPKLHSFGCTQEFYAVCRCAGCGQVDASGSAFAQRQDITERRIFRS